MTDVRLAGVAITQDGVVASWQLVRAGMSEQLANYWTRGLRRLHDGVFVTGWGEITERQRCWGPSSPHPALC